MQATARKIEFTDEDYIRLEDKSEIKHEFINGQLYAMAGGSPTHARLGFNAIAAIGARLRGKRCHGASSDQRIKIENSRDKVYPDALIVCPPALYDENDPHALLNPKVVIEILSPSTEKRDRTGKFELYKQISSLTDYILIEQDWVRVEHYRRAEGRLWTIETFNQRDQSLILPDIEIELPLEEIYDGLDIPSGLLLMKLEED